MYNRLLPKSAEAKFPTKKSRIKATKQKQCISNPQNDSLMKLKNRKR